MALRESQGAIMQSVQYLADPSKPVTGLDWLQPRARPQFHKLADKLTADWAAGLAPALILPFETYRSPARQAHLMKVQQTTEPPWTSAHEYGFAVDFVPYVGDAWLFWVPDDVWEYLKHQAELVGLRVPFAHAKMHVEHGLFSRVRAVLRD